MTDSRFATWTDKAYKGDRFDAVVKVGGSVVYGPWLANAVDALLTAATSTRLLLFPGGGEPDVFFERLFSDGTVSGPTLNELTALAQDQTGLVLADQSPRLAAARTIAEVAELQTRGLVPVLLPSAVLRTTDVFRSTNRVTSDSQAAWLAQLVRAPRLVVMKSRLPHGSTLEDLREDDILDEVFPDLVAAAGLACDICTAGASHDELVAWLAGRGEGGAGGVSLS